MASGTTGGRQSRLILRVVIFAVRAGHDALPPFLLTDVPANRFLEAFFKRMRGSPSQLSFYFRWVDCVSSIVPGSIRNEANKRLRLLQESKQRTDDVDVLALGTPANVVDGTSLP